MSGAEQQIIASDKVIACLVTYGDRWKYLEEVLDRLSIDACIGGIVVVDNASTPSVRERISAKPYAEKIEVIELAENYGSARGFGEALHFSAKNYPRNLIYILDDDNLPETNAVRHLLDSWNGFGSNPNVCCLSFRPDRPDQVLALAGQRRMTHRKNSFMGFHFSDLPIKIVKRFASPLSFEPCLSRVEVAYAPYGGLLLSPGWVGTVGLPDPTYFVYVDDHEYTHRIRGAGGKIILVKDSVVHDIESSWYRVDKCKNGGILSEETPKFRLHYSVRNRVRFEREWLMSNAAIYLLNAVIFLTLQFVKTLIRERMLWSLVTKTKFFLRSAWLGWLMGSKSGAP